METKLQKRNCAEGTKGMEILRFCQRQETRPFLVLRNGEKDFEMYVNIDDFVERVSNCYIKISPASMTLLLKAYIS